MTTKIYKWVPALVYLALAPLSLTAQSPCTPCKEKPDYTNGFVQWYYCVNEGSLVVQKNEYNEYEEFIRCTVYKQEIDAFVNPINFEEAETDNFYTLTLYLSSDFIFDVTRYEYGEPVYEAGDGFMTLFFFTRETRQQFRQLFP